jgi:hypothetical protein
MKEAGYNELKDYEGKRVSSFGAYYESIDAKAQSLKSILKRQASELDNLRSFLRERSSMERDYAARLTKLSTKLRVRGTQAAAADSTVAASAPEETVGRCEIFVGAMCQVYNTMGTMIAEFSQLVSDSLCKDVQSHFEVVRQRMQ